MHAQRELIRTALRERADICCTDERCGRLGERGKVLMRRIVDEDHHVRVPYADRSRLAAVDPQRPAELRRGEIDRDPLGVAPGADHAARGVQLEAIAALAIEQVPGDAARAVPAGIGDRSIGVVNDERPAPAIRLADDEDPVGADAGPAIAERPRPRGVR